MNILFQFILVLAIFLVVSYAAWYMTEKDKVPEYLNYKPFSCRICATTWSLAAVYIALGISFKWWVLLIVGLIVTALNAIALVVNQKNKTINIEDYDDDKFGR